MSDDKTTLETALRIGERLGVPLLILAAILWMAREAGIAVYGGAVVPVVRAHTTFLESTQETLRGIESTQSRQADTMDEIVAGQRELTAIIKEERRN